MSLVSVAASVIGGVIGLIAQDRGRDWQCSDPGPRRVIEAARGSGVDAAILRRNDVERARGAVFLTGLQHEARTDPRDPDTDRWQITGRTKSGVQWKLEYRPGDGAYLIVPPGLRQDSQAVSDIAATIAAVMLGRETQLPTVATDLIETAGMRWMKQNERLYSYVSTSAAFQCPMDNIVIWKTGLTPRQAAGAELAWQIDDINRAAYSLDANTAASWGLR